MKTLAVMHMLLVQDMDRALSFYERTFDFKTEQKNDFWSNMSCGNGMIALCSYGNKAERKETTLIIEVDSYQEAVERIAANNGEVLKVSEPYEGAPVWNVEFLDTENNQLVASQRV